MRAFLSALLVCVCWTEVRTAVRAAVRAAPAPNGGCQRPEVLLKAGLAVDQINNDRTEGYVFGLNRVYDVTYQNGLIYQVSVDVMETDCHVLSRKPWKQCEGKSIGAVPVEGQCKLTFNGASLTYSCELRPVSPIAILQVCPDCPTGLSVNDKDALNTVNILLVKFNTKSGQPNPFSLLSITQFTMPYMVGPAFFVEFSIQDKISGRKGFCKGGLFKGPGPENTLVDCQIYKAETSPRPRPSGSVVVLAPLDNVPPRPPPSSAQCPSVRTYCVVNCR